MEYWAIICLSLSILSGLFGFESITNSVPGISLVLTFFFALLTVGAAAYSARQEDR
jgi:uncharacterized membrane protein YtjA (UPF0391 family)